MFQFKLSDEQSAAVDKCKAFLQGGSQVFRVSGPAGTGKTTIIKSVVGLSGVPPAVAAFMGKAADVLRRKGLPGQTLHSLMYEWDGEEFYRMKGLACDFVIVDEGSTVGGALWSDLLSFGKKVIVFGDDAQLEPVDDTDPHLMRDADVQLTTIHRQALDNPIIKLATDIRVAGCGFESVQRPLAELDEGVLLWPDVWICGFNKTRIAMNAASRRARGYGANLCVGDRLKCVSNDKKLGVFNGTTFEVVEIISANRGNVRRVLGRFDGSGEPREVTITTAGLGLLKKLPWDKARHYMGKAIIVDYAYAITGHASQGSEYPLVGIVDEQCDLWCPKRWRYTAITRAAQDFKVFAQ